MVCPRVAGGDIHIFWWQACGKALENQAKQLIYIVFPVARQSRALDRKTGLIAAARRLDQPEDIHIFWWQACAEPLEKSLKPLIRQRIFKAVQAASASVTGISTAPQAHAREEICTHCVCKTVENVLTSHSSH